jgi:hypothetical protein
MTHDPYAILVPGVPLFAPETTLADGEWLAGITDTELQYWPRRNVSAVALMDEVTPCPCGCSAHVRAMLVLN